MPTMGEAEVDDLRQFKRCLQSSQAIVGFTGAGISTEAGISDYRSQGGIWEKFTPVYLNEFRDDPGKRVLYWQRKKALWHSIKNAQPTAAHRFFVDLYRRNKLAGLITQNIDGLHEKSGLPAESIVNLHGTTLEIICLKCQAITPAEPLMQQLDPEQPPLCEFCNGLLKPNTISFGQQLVEHLEESGVSKDYCVRSANPTTLGQFVMDDLAAAVTTATWTIDPEMGLTQAVS